MKAFISLLIALFFAVAVSAQTPQSFRYQAVARDNSGNVLANQEVSFRISIISGRVSGPAEYIEIHSGLTTNNFGLVELEIGKGMPVSGIFSSIYFGGNNYFVKVEMDPAGGTVYQELSTSQLLSVPYALHSKNAEQVPDNSVTGAKIASMDATTGQALKWNGTSWTPADVLSTSEATWNKSGSNIYYNTGNVGLGTSTPSALLHANGIGMGGGNVLFNGEIKFSNPGNPPATGMGTRMMWYPDKAAFRAGHVGGTEWDKNQTGHYSSAFGNSTKASGWASIAAGELSNASGDWSVALGSNSTASGETSFAMGEGTNALGVSSIAFGTGTTASGDASTSLGVFTNVTNYAGLAIGQHNIGGGTPDSWVLTDPLFEIGIGTSEASKNNAMTVLKNGNTGIGTDAPTALLHTRGTGNGQGNVVFVGSYKLNDPGPPPVSGAGTRMMWYPDKAAFRAGNVSGTSFWDQENIGIFSFAVGWDTKASGNYSSAWGMFAKAEGYCASAMGSFTTALGDYSTAMGYFSNAESYSSLVLGRYNIGGGNATEWVDTDPIFEIGNGWQQGLEYRVLRNAFTVLKNGNTGIATYPHPRQQLSVGDYLDLYSGFLNSPTRPSIRASSNNNLIINSYGTGILYFNFDEGTGETRFYAGAGGAELLRINPNGRVGIGTGSPTQKLHVVGDAYKTEGGTAWATSSDLRLKTVLGNYKKGLDEIALLEAVRYVYQKDNPRQLSSDMEQVGFIAQEVQKVFPEAVSEAEDGYLDFNIHPINVALVNAIKELKAELNLVKSENDQMKKQIENFNARLEQMEALTGYNADK